MQFETTKLNEAIAKRMGETKVIRYVIHMNGELVMAFMDGNCYSMESAEQWLKDRGRLGSDVSGATVVSELAWPDYINETAHATRFINWALTKLTKTQIVSLCEEIPNVNVQLRLAGMLFADEQF